MFDALVKLTYNMQVYKSALKVATSWKQNSNFNRNPNNRCRHNVRYKPSKIKSKNEETGSSGDPMDIDDKIDIPQFLSSVDMSESEDTPLLSSSQTPMFSQAIALAKNLVFFSQDDGNVVNVDVDVMANDDEFKMHHEDNAIIDDILDASIVDSEDEKQNMLALESYGRQCTLPFLQFATLLKKYVYEDGEDNLDENLDLSTLSSPHQQGDLNVEHDTQKELLMNPSCANPLIKNSPHCHQWSCDDYEYFTLACYLKLINYDENAYEDCGNYEEVDISNSCKNNEDHSPNHVDVKQCIPFQPPSVMEAVIWPQWSYSTPDMNDNISTIISRAWLTSFRLALSPRIPRATIICDNTSVSPAAQEIDPNSNANIIMAARLLLAVDCCAGGVNNYIRKANENNDSISDNSLCLLPTIKWTGPRLLKLPHCYDGVFQYYHARPCHRCHGIPRETSLCLICGTVVCLKENCCQTNGIFEAVQVSTIPSFSSIFISYYCICLSFLLFISICV